MFYIEEKRNQNDSKNTEAVRIFINNKKQKSTKNIFNSD